jgi:hypothetical protein
MERNDVHLMKQMKIGAQRYLFDEIDSMESETQRRPKFENSATDRSKARDNRDALAMKLQFVSS